MAIGTGATTAVFSVVKGILLTPLPYREPNRIVLFRADLRGYPQQPLLTGEEKEALRDRTDLFESVASVYQSEGNLTSGLKSIIGKFRRSGPKGEAATVGNTP